jgi:hypothetical protein
VDIRVMSLGAGAFFAEVGILAPTAVDEVLFLAYGSADGAGFQEFGDDVAGEGSPVVHDLMFFADFGQIFFAHHGQSSELATCLDATRGPRIDPLCNLSVYGSNLQIMKYLP